MYSFTVPLFTLVKGLFTPLSFCNWVVYHLLLLEEFFAYILGISPFSDLCLTDRYSWSVVCLPFCFCNTVFWGLTLAHCGGSYSRASVWYAVHFKVFLVWFMEADSSWPCATSGKFFHLFFSSDFPGFG